MIEIYKQIRFWKQFLATFIMFFIIVPILERCTCVVHYEFRLWRQIEVLLEGGNDASDENTRLESLDTVLPTQRSKFRS